MLFNLLSLTILSHSLDFAGKAEKEFASPKLYINLGQMQKLDANIIQHKNLPPIHRNLESLGHGHPHFGKEQTFLHRDKLTPLSLNRRELKREDLMTKLDPKCLHEFRLKQRNNRLLLKDLMTFLEYERIDFKREYPILTILDDKFKKEPHYKLTEADNTELTKMFTKLDLCPKLRTENLELFKLLEPRCNMLMRLNKREWKSDNLMTCQDSKCQEFRLKQKDNLLLLKDLMSHLKQQKIDFKREFPILTILDDKFKEEPHYKLTDGDNIELNKMFMKLDLCQKLRIENCELFKLLKPRCRMLMRLNKRDFKGYNIGSPILAFKIGELDNGAQSATFIKGYRM